MASNSSAPTSITALLPPSLDLPPHLSAHKYFFVCTLTVAAWDTLVLSPRTWKLLRLQGWPLLKIIYHFIRVFMPIEFAIVGTSLSHLFPSYLPFTNIPSRRFLRYEVYGNAMPAFLPLRTYLHSYSHLSVLFGPCHPYQRHLPKQLRSQVRHVGSVRMSSHRNGRYMRFLPSHAPPIPILALLLRSRLHRRTQVRRQSSSRFLLGPPHSALHRILPPRRSPLRAISKR